MGLEFNGYERVMTMELDVFIHGDQGLVEQFNTTAKSNTNVFPGLNAHAGVCRCSDIGGT